MSKKQEIAKKVVSTVDDTLRKYYGTVDDAMKRADDFRIGPSDKEVRRYVKFKREGKAKELAALLDDFKVKVDKANAEGKLPSKMKTEVKADAGSVKNRGGIGGHSRKGQSTAIENEVNNAAELQRVNQLNNTRRKATQNGRELADDVAIKAFDDYLRERKKIKKQFIEKIS